MTIQHPCPAALADPANDPLPTRLRILCAAQEIFAATAYESAGLRDIARCAGVDVAWVHRSFGSKEQLFAEAFRAAIRDDCALLSASPDLPEAFCTLLLRDHRSPGPRGFPILIRSLSSPAASLALKDAITQEFIAPLAARLHGPAPATTARLAALLGGVVAGLGLCHNVLELPQMTDAPPDQLRADLLRIFRAVLTV
jgi:AcrR family transcriptional regulator